MIYGLLSRPAASLTWNQKCLSKIHPQQAMGNSSVSTASVWWNNGNNYNVLYWYFLSKIFYQKSKENDQ